MASQMENHLRTYVEDGIQQKIRLNNLITDYQAQELKTRERVIDQQDLENKFIAEGISQDRIDLVAERSRLDKEVLIRVQKTLGTIQENRSGVVLRMNAHLEELSQIEIDAGGFVTHAVGIDEGAQFDQDSKTITFEYEGHVEIPIAVRMNKWKDNSQLTIKKIKKAGI